MTGTMRRAGAMLGIARTAILLLTLAAVHGIKRRAALVRQSGDRGSISVEKAVITAISLALALALMGAIAAVVAKYQSRIE